MFLNTRKIVVNKRRLKNQGANFNLHGIVLEMYCESMIRPCEASLPFAFDCMDGGGRTAHEAVAECLSKGGMSFDLLSIYDLWVRTVRILEGRINNVPTDQFE